MARNCKHCHQMDRVIEKKRWTMKRIAFTGGSAFLGIFLLYLWIGADFSPRLNVDSERIAIAEVKSGEFLEYITVDGVIQPLKTIFLDAVEGGVIEKIHVEDGATVNEGNLLITLSNSNLQLDYVNRETQILELMNQIDNARINLNQNTINRQSQLAEIEYQLKLAERKYKQNKELYEGKVVSENDYKLAEDDFQYLQKRRKILQNALKQDSILTMAQIKQMDFSVNRMRQNLGMVKDNLQHLDVRAPVAGRLSSFEAETGQLIGKGQNLGQIDVPQGSKVRAQIDEHYISRVFTGQTASLEMNGEKFPLEVKKIFPKVSNGFFTVDLYFTEKQPDNIKKGQNVNLKLPLSTQSTALLLQRGSFIENTGGAWAFVLDKNGNVAEKRNIKTGRQNPQYIEVLEGLQEGDKVVISSYVGYEDKDKLVIK